MKQQHFLLGSILKLWLQKMCSIDWLEHWTIFGQINFKYSSAFKVFNLMFKNVQRSLRQIFCQKIYILTPCWAHEMKMYKQTKKLNKWPKKTVNAVIISEFYLMKFKVPVQFYSICDDFLVDQQINDVVPQRLFYLSTSELKQKRLQ